MTKTTDYSTVVCEESNQMSDVQFLFNKYEEATQKILRLKEELEAARSAVNASTDRIDDLEYDIRNTRRAINMGIAECLDEDHDFKPKSKVTKQDLLNALQTISHLVNE